ncbi:unnamed protein product [Durusdinium trenchii]|uniref:Uncharacterized protein n=1 Tax=Durusdinium trenchii TaxID=1381693 RepID=A0ABP0IQL8_9DINO
MTDSDARTFALQVVGESACRFLAASNDTKQQNRGRELCGSLLQTDAQGARGTSPRHSLAQSHHYGPSPPPYDTPQPSWPGGCKQYCQVFMGTCREPNSPIGRYYSSISECRKECATIPVTQQNVQQGNTMACRAFHAALSLSTTSQTAFHCNHAYVVDPMYICRNYPIPDWDGKDMRQIIYDTFGAYSSTTSLLQTGSAAKMLNSGKGVCDICKCRDNVIERVKIVSCQGLGLNDDDFKALMRKMPSSVEILDLSANEITKIPQNVFVNAKNLLGLDLASNQITKIKSGAFNKLDSLVSLLLDGNWNLSQIDDDILYPLTELVELGLANGAVPEIPRNFFKMNTKLQFATMFGQAYSSLPAGQGLPTMHLES